jgi:hypothetical protein
MAEPIETLYAFGKEQADHLLSLCPKAGRIQRHERRSRQFMPLVCKTGGSGIAAASTATVTVREPTATSWADGDAEVTAWNIHPTATVAADTIIIVMNINGRWVVIWEACP